MCGPRGRSPRPFWVSLCFLALFLSAPATLRAEDPGRPTSPQPSGPPPSSESPRLTPLAIVSLLDEATQTLVDESIELSKEARTHSAEQEIDRQKLSESLIELNALKLSRDSFKGLFETSLASSERLEEKALEAIEAEALKAARAERIAGRWKAGALAAATFAVFGWVAFAATLAF